MFDFAAAAAVASVCMRSSAKQQQQEQQKQFVSAVRPVLLRASQWGAELKKKYLFISFLLGGLVPLEFI